MRTPYLGNPVTKIRARWTDLRDPTPVHVHIDELLKLDMTINMIARAAGVAEKTVTYLHRRTYQTVTTEVADAVLSVSPRPHRNQALVMAFGARRRLQALAFEGHSMTAVGAELGWSQSRIGVIHHAVRITWGTHVAVRDGFDKLSGIPGGNRQTIAHARRNGYLPAFAWDDFDDYYEAPDPKLALWRRSTANEERIRRRGDVYRLTQAGLSAAEIADRVGVSQRQVVRDRTFLARQEAS